MQSQSEGESRGTADVTIAISTLDREASLRATLDSLAAADLSGVTELIIVDQGAKPFDAALLSPKFPVPVRVIAQRARGLGVSRNEALRQAAGEIVLFLDDDVTVEPQLIEEHRGTYREYPNALGVAGFEQLLDSGSAARRWVRGALGWLYGQRARWHRALRGYLDEDGRPVAVVTGSGLVIADFSRPHPCRVMTPRGCNMSWRRAVLQRVGGFDPEWVGPRRDETDLALRVLRACPGGELRFNPNARLLHRMVPNGGCRSARARSWHEALLRCELRFARRNLSAFGVLRARLRLFVAYAPALLRHPGLLHLWWAER